MIKKLKIVILSLFLVTALITLTQLVPCKAEATTKVSSTYLCKVKKAYLNTIRNLVSVDYFALKDLNGDDVPELIVNGYNIYTYINGKVKVMEPFDAGNYVVAYYPDCKTIEIKFYHMGLGCYFYYECGKESMNLRAAYYYYNDAPDFFDVDVPSYEIDGSTVTKSEFADYCDGLGQGQKIKFYYASKSNLSKYLYKEKVYTYKNFGISANEASHKFFYVTGVSDTGFSYRNAKLGIEDIKFTSTTHKIKFSSNLKLYIFNEIGVNYKQVEYGKKYIKKYTCWIPLYKHNKLFGLAEQYMP